jgi:hypothetical protein
MAPEAIALSAELQPLAHPESPSTGLSEPVFPSQRLLMWRVHWSLPVLAHPADSVPKAKARQGSCPDGPHLLRYPRQATTTDLAVLWDATNIARAFSFVKMGSV